MEKLLYSGSPHIRGKRTTKQIMMDVCIALLPATIVGIIYFGVNALITVLVSIVGALLGELVFRLCKKQTFKQAMKDFDFTSLVTGLLLGLNLPPLGLTGGAAIYVPLLGSIFAIIVVKMLFGGTGRNIVNPALAGRVFILISFMALLNTWYVLPNIAPLAGEPLGGIGTGATPFTELISGAAGSGGIYNMGLSNLDLLLGTGVAGAIGETCKLALLLGFVYLIVRGVIKWYGPVLYIITTGVMAVILRGFNINFFLPSILSGGLFLGAIFMATDYTTTPNTFIGNIIYFVLLGIITGVLREVCSMETVSFSIMLGNLIVPLIDKFIFPKPFGTQKPVKPAKVAQGGQAK